MAFNPEWAVGSGGTEALFGWATLSFLGKPKVECGALAFGLAVLSFGNSRAPIAVEARESRVSATSTRGA